MSRRNSLADGAPRSWYRATSKPHVPRPVCDRRLQADVCVVGAGLAGLTTTLELLKAGKTVVLLEAKQVGWGASGRNGGFVIAGFAQDLSTIIEHTGLSRAKQLYALSQQGVEYVRSQIERLDPDVKTGEGYLLVSRCRDNAAFHGHANLLLTEFSHPVESWSPDRVRQTLNSDRYFGGIYDATALHIHPLNYALSLAAEIERLGGSVYENSRAIALRTQPNGAVVSTPAGEVCAQHIVLCTSAYDHRLFRPLSRAILPVSTHIAVSAPLLPPYSEVIRTHAAIADTRRAGNYYRMVDYDRLLWGGAISTRRSPPRHLEKRMRASLKSAYPQLSRIEFEYCWSGLMGYCLHKMPIIGQIEPHIWSATGFGGHGLNTTAMAGCLIASAIAQGDDRWRCFSTYPASWAGGPLGRAGAQMSYWFMQAKDRLEESKKAR